MRPSELPPGHATRDRRLATEQARAASGTAPTANSGSRVVNGAGPNRRTVLPARTEPRFEALHTTPPARSARGTLLALVTLLAALMVWAAIGRIDVVAVTEGRLVPATRVQIVQPFEAGIVREVMVREGERVSAGQALMHMDTTLHAADQRVLRAELQARALALRRIDAELTGQPLTRHFADPPDAFARTAAQWRANRQAHESGLAHERATHARARGDLASAVQIREKLAQVLPHYEAQERAYRDLESRGFAGRLLASEKSRDRIEKTRDLAAQDAAIESAQAAIAQSERRLDTIVADYRRALQSEKVEVAQRHAQAAEELRKLDHRSELQVLRAPQAGVVKDLATHTPGVVAAAGTVLMSLVPANAALVAEVWVRNEDIGFVHEGQPVMLKLAAFPFQKYGLVSGTVETVGADASEPSRAAGAQTAPAPTSMHFRTLVRLHSTRLVFDGRDYALTPGMQVTAEIRLGDRTLLEYLLAPVQKAWREAGRER